jgi:hypothetical protein
MEHVSHAQIINLFHQIKRIVLQLSVQEETRLCKEMELADHVSLVKFQTLPREIASLNPKLILESHLLQEEERRFL